MKTHHVACGFALGLSFAFAAGTTLRQDAPPGMTEEGMAMVQAMRAAHNNPTAPGDFHEKLGHFVGNWDVTIRMWPMGPDVPAMESRGAAAVEWMYDGRFGVETLEAELDMGGMKIPLQSTTITGYDSYRNQYVGTMYSNMSTEMIHYQGGVTPDGSTFNFYGAMHEPMLKVAGRLVRFETKIMDGDHHVTSVYDLHAGEDYKVLEFDYRRQQ